MCSSDLVGQAAELLALQSYLLCRVTGLQNHIAPASCVTGRHKLYKSNLTTGRARVIWAEMKPSRQVCVCVSVPCSKLSMLYCPACTVFLALCALLPSLYRVLSSLCYTAQPAAFCCLPVQQLRCHPVRAPVAPLFQTPYTQTPNP